MHSPRQTLDPLEGKYQWQDRDVLRAVQALEPDVICTDRPDLLLAAIKDD
jgi:hypothetical protein